MPHKNSLSKLLFSVTLEEQPEFKNQSISRSSPFSVVEAFARGGFSEGSNLRTYGPYVMVEYNCISA